MATTLTKTFGSGNQKTFTLSGWYKRAETGVEHRIFSSHNTGSPAGYASMHFHTSDDLIIFNYNGSSSYQYLRTDRKLRDLSAWYHIVLACDTTQATASERVKLYINGVQETSFSTETIPSQNANLYFNDDVKIIDKKWNSLKKLIKKKNINKKDCILLPFKTLKKIVSG